MRDRDYAFRYVLFFMRRNYSSELGICQELRGGIEGGSLSTTVVDSSILGEISLCFTDPPHGYPALSRFPSLHHLQPDRARPHGMDAAAARPRRPDRSP